MGKEARSASVHKICILTKVYEEGMKLFISTNIDVGFITSEFGAVVWIVVVPIVDIFIFLYKIKKINKINKK